MTGVAEGVRSFGSPRRAVILAAIVVANVQHITRSAVRTWRYAGSDQIPPDSERRPVSVNSLALSVGLPFETVRGHINALIDEGLCIKTDLGIIVPNEVLTSAKVVASEQVVWDAFWSMIEELRLINFDFEAVRRRTDIQTALVLEPGFPTDVGQPPRRLISRVTAEFYVSCILSGAAAYGDWGAASVASVVMVANAEQLAQDPQQAWLYSTQDAPPPDEIRRPVTIREVAQRLNMDRESVRRQFHVLVAQDKLIKVDGGYLSNMKFLQTPEVLKSGMDMVTAFYRMIYDLTALGVRL